jgi:uncharacterized SAM-binding protein YcdF (DUF218 family)
MIKTSLHKILKYSQSTFTRRRLMKMMVVLLVLWLWVAFISAIVIFAYGEQNQIDNTQTDIADVIIVLGSGLRSDGRSGDALIRRSLWAARLYEQGAAPELICTGGVGRTQTNSEASACRDLLVSNGVPVSAIHLEEQSRSTEENAIYAKGLMEDNGWQNAIIVTDSFHMFRAHLIFDGKGIIHYNSPVPRQWVRKGWYIMSFTRELVAIQWQTIKETFNLPYTNVG